MIKVKLDPVQNSAYIFAPPHCPYKQLHSAPVIGYIVNSALCNLCKMCEFQVEDVLKLDFKTEEFISYITLRNEQVSRLISNQVAYLNKQGRIPLTILISPELFGTMLNTIYCNDDVMKNAIRAHFITHEMPICTIVGSPVYLSRKLSQSLVQVVGEVAWK